MRRPSPALVVAVIALVGSWAGPAVARSLITTKDIRDRTIRGRDIASNTITGRNVENLSGRDIVKDGIDGSDIDESTLDTVPRATTASRLSGVRVVRLDFRRGTGTGDTGLFDEGDLRITASCDDDGTLHLGAVPTADGGVIRLHTTRPGTPADDAAYADDDFSGGDRFDMVIGGAGGLSGTLTYAAPSGDDITLQYLTQDHLDPARGYACLVSGTAVRTS